MGTPAGTEVVQITTTEMHTGGEPVRIVESGYPPVPGDTILDKRRFVSHHLDHLRTFLMLEPRGHADMYGVIPVEPDAADADLAVLFMHNAGYSTMCGHAVLAVATYAVTRRLVDVTEPETHLVVQAPCGPVDVWVEIIDGAPATARFRSVEGFVAALGVEVEVPGFGRVVADIGYGGAFYAVAAATGFGLDVASSPIGDLVGAATALSRALGDHPAVDHPDSVDLGFLYGSILVDDASLAAGETSANVCVFADAQVDRSATGSGVTARLAIAHARGEVGVRDRRSFRSVIGTEMTGEVVETVAVGNRPGVVVEVAGRAFMTGRATFTLDPADPLAAGFRLR